jgi:type IV pilus assembly protein PilW
VFYCAQKGFTLIEMLIALAIGSLLLAGTYNFYVSQKKIYAIREQVAEMQQNARAGMALMVREIRMAGYNPVGAPGIGLIEAGLHTIHITMDLHDNDDTNNPDGDTDDENEDVIYSLYDSGKDRDFDLGRTVHKGKAKETKDPVAENIKTLDFEYTLADGSKTSTPADPRQIRMVRITLTARTPKPDPNYRNHDGYRTYTLESFITPRNLVF